MGAIHHVNAFLTAGFMLTVISMKENNAKIIVRLLLAGQVQKMTALGETE